MSLSECNSDKRHEEYKIEETKKDLKIFLLLFNCLIIGRLLILTKQH